MRAFLLILTNLAVVFAMGAFVWLLTVLGILPPYTESSYLGLFALSLILGFGGSVVSLLMSKTIAKASVGAQVIAEPRNELEQWLVQTVREHAQKIGIGMPEVAIYASPDMNAFATGARRDASLVAVSTGLLNGMTRDEASAVLGHEITHVANGDMVTLTLIQGVTNTFVFFFSTIVARILMSSRDDNRRGNMFGEFMVRQLLMMAFGWVAAIIVAWFSRRREFRADFGGATLDGPAAMANALRRLQSREPPDMPASLKAFGIRGGASSLLATHPPIDVRIARVEAMAMAA